MSGWGFSSFKGLKEKALNAASEAGEIVKKKIQEQKEEFLLEKAKYATPSPADSWDPSEGLAPWHRLTPEHQYKEGEVRSRILNLTKDRRNFTTPPPEAADFKFHLESYSPLAQTMLKEDSDLSHVRYRLVPKEVDEETFWRNYFYRIGAIREAACAKETASDNIYEAADQIFAGQGFETEEQQPQPKEEVAEPEPQDQSFAINDPQVENTPEPVEAAAPFQQEEAPSPIYAKPVERSFEIHALDVDEDSLNDTDIHDEFVSDTYQLEEQEIADASLAVNASANPVDANVDDWESELKQELENVDISTTDDTIGDADLEKSLQELGI